MEHDHRSNVIHISKKAKLEVEKQINRHREELCFGRDTRHFANHYVEVVYQAKPSVLTGKAGNITSPDCVAALALAYAVAEKPKSDSDWFDVLVMLESALADIKMQQPGRKFTAAELKLIEEAEDAFTKAIEWKDSAGVSILDLCKRFSEENY